VGGMGGSAPKIMRNDPVRAFREHGSLGVEPRTDTGRGRGVLQHRPAGSLVVVIQLFISLRPAIRFVSLGGTGEPDHRP
jgi:hypothetical protein